MDASTYDTDEAAGALDQGNSAAEVGENHSAIQIWRFPRRGIVSWFPLENKI